MSQELDEIEQRLVIAAAALRKQREYQKRLDLALTLTGVGMWDWEMATDTLTWDARMCELFGVSVRSKKTYRTFFNKVLKADQPLVQAAIDAALQGEDYDIRYRIKGKESCCKWIHARGLLHKNGGPPKLIGVCMEIIDRCSC